MDPPKSPADPTFSLADLYPLAVAHKFYSVSTLHEAAVRVAAAAAATGTPFRAGAVAEALGFGPVGEPLLVSGSVDIISGRAADSYGTRVSGPLDIISGRAADSSCTRVSGPVDSFGTRRPVDSFSGTRQPVFSFRSVDTFRPLSSVSTGSGPCGSGSSTRMFSYRKPYPRSAYYSTSSAAAADEAGEAAAGGGGRGGGGGGGGGRCPPEATDCGAWRPDGTPGGRAPDAVSVAELMRRIEDVRAEALRNHANNKMTLLRLGTDLSEAKAHYLDAASKATKQVGVIGFRMFLGLGCFSFMSMVYYINQFGKLAQAPPVVVVSSSSTPPPTTSSTPPPTPPPPTLPPPYTRPTAPTTSSKA